MNKSELVEVVADKTEMTKAAAGGAVEALLETIAESVARGEAVTLIGFGTFEARKRAARAGKNPRTGETLKIAATTVPAFKAGKAFKDKVAAAAGKKGGKKKKYPVGMSVRTSPPHTKKHRAAPSPAATRQQG